MSTIKAKSTPKRLPVSQASKPVRRKSKRESKAKRSGASTSSRRVDHRVFQALAIRCPITRWIRSKPFNDCVGEELKCYKTGPARVSDTVFEAADTSVASDFVSLNKVYRFRLGGQTSVTQTTGVINTFFACDPSAAGTNFPEWSTLSALFSEFRLVEYGVQFVSDGWSFGALGTASAPASCLIAGNLGTAVAPGSLTAVADNADSRYVQFAKDTTNCGYTHVINGQGIGWSQVTTPTTTPYAGAPGCIQVYGSFGSVSQAGALRCLVWGIYEFRSRV